MRLEGWFFRPQVSSPKSRETDDGLERDARIDDG